MYIPHRIYTAFTSSTTSGSDDVEECAEGVGAKGARYVGVVSEEAEGLYAE